GGAAAGAVTTPRAAWTAPPVAPLEPEVAAATVSARNTVRPGAGMRAAGAIGGKLMGVAAVVGWVSMAREYYKTGGIHLGTFAGPNGPEEIGIGMQTVQRQVGTVPANAPYLPVNAAEKTLREGDYF